MTKGWHEGTIGIPQKDGSAKIAKYLVKANTIKSKNGINGGKITKLSIRIEGEYVAKYDGGWEIEPDENNQNVMVAYCICLQSYN